MKKIALSLLIGVLLFLPAYAGNDSKRGLAGAGELLIFPFARENGMALSNVAGVRGPSSMFLNVGGMAHTRGTHVELSRTSYLSGTDVGINGVGVAQGVSESGTLGFSLMTVDMGEFITTTYNQPGGTGGTFSPQLFNFGMAYSQKFSDNISGGIVVRVISQSLPSVNAVGAAFDAGIQYTAGDKDQYKLGVSARNLGPKMRYTGDGLTQRSEVQNQTFFRTMGLRSEAFDLPSLLDIAGSYDYYFDPANRLTIAETFTSNSFTKDQFKTGLEYGFKGYVMARAGFAYQEDIFNSSERTVAHTGLTAGASLRIPLDKKFNILQGKAVDENGQMEKQAEAENGKKDSGKGPQLGVDYAFQTANPFSGTHSVGLVLTL